MYKCNWSNSTSKKTTLFVLSLFFISIQLFFSGWVISGIEDAYAYTTNVKKGVCSYQYSNTDVSKLSALNVGWFYNWSNTCSSNLSGVNLEYVPMLWGPGSVTSSNISALTTAKNNGQYTNLLGFNEPDLPDQANMTPDQALALWPQLMSTGLRLGSPAPCTPISGWLDEFMAKADNLGYRVDFVALHVYQDFTHPDSVDNLKDALTEVYNKYKKPIWLTEIGAPDTNHTGYAPYQTPTQALADTYLTQVTAMLESLGFIERYSWFDDNCSSAPVLRFSTLYSSTDTLTSMGNIYKNYSSYPYLSITTTSLPIGTVGTAYSSTTLAKNGGTSPYIWSTAGLPNGLSLNTSTGVISGTPTVPGRYETTIKVIDSRGQNTYNKFTITINGTGNYNIRKEADDNIGSWGVAKEVCSDTGGGLNICDYNGGDWTTYTINIPVAGNYNVDFRVANPVAGGALELRKADGSTVLCTASIPNTGGNEIYSTVRATGTANFEAGEQTIWVYSTATSGKLNWLNLSATAASTSVMTEAESYISSWGVIKETTVDNGSGQDVYDLNAGDWMNYTVNVPSTGTYNIDFRVANTVNGGVLQLKNSAGTVLCSISVPNTGGGQTWTTVRTTASLSAGTQTLTLYSPTTSGKINWFGLSTVSSSVTTEAESYISSWGVIKETATDIGGGQDVYDLNAGDWMNYTINVASSGTYNIDFRVANTVAGGVLQLKNSAGTVLCTISVPNTGGGQTWTTVRTTASLSAGTQTFTVYSTTTSGKLNWFTFSK